LQQLQHLSVDGIDGLQLQLGPSAAAAGAAAAVAPPLKDMQQQAQHHRATAAAAAATAAAAAVRQVSLQPSAMLSPLHLTTLRLHSCKLAAGQGWEMLAGLARLQQLELISVAPGDAAAVDTAAQSAAAESPVFGAALANLQQLTSLKLQLSQRLDGSAVAAARHLSKLRRMDLHRVGMQECPVCLDDLPGSLTGLTAFGCYYGSSARAGCSSGTCQLAALKTLQLELCVGWDTGLAGALLGCCSLQRLVYVAAAGDHVEGTMAQLLAAAPALAGLQHLHLSVTGLCSSSDRV
jgi:hypothetical protein